MAGDPDFLSVQLLLHGDGSNNGTVFTDNSRSARTVTRGGNTVTSTTQYKYGTASLYFDGVNDWLSVADAAALRFGTDNFTIEFWIYANAAAQTQTTPRIITKGTTATTGAWNVFYTKATGALSFATYAPSATTHSIGTLTDDTWTHVAICRSSGTVYTFLAGTLITTASDNTNLVATTAIALGVQNTGTQTDDFIGYLDDVRITVGVARYTSTFTPSTTAFPNNWEIDEATSDAIGTADETDYRWTYEDALSQGIGMAEANPVRERTGVSDTFRSQDFLARNSRFSPTLSDTAATAETLRYDYGYVFRETIRLADPTIPVAKYGLTLSDVARIADRLMVGRPVTLTQGVGVAPAVTGVIGALVVERLRLTELVLPVTKYGVTQADGIRIGDAFTRFVGGALSETIGMQDALTPRFYINRTLTETLGISETVTPRLLFRVIATDAVGVHDAQVLKLIFRGALTDAIQISAAYVSPDGNFTTWAINTKTGAVTEYDNFTFNSFARSGFKYLAASSSGLYELDGDDDAGTDIISVIKSGLAQLGGSRFSMFKAAYLGMRGGGDVYLKLETGNGVVYTYKVTTEEMRTTKVNLGKGLRARYFSFQLTSTGQDFDLESIEFVPIVAQRRV